jgi:peptidoglycan hydrolase-like protein with peptidoglycan-binding domain
MARTLFAAGLCGEIAEQIQRGLLAAGFNPGTVDGFYGKDTTTALRSFQQAKGHPVTGAVDVDTWKLLLDTDVPSTARRCLSLTATIEGHGYTLAQGNWDDAWLTWGIIGFTMKHGEVQAIIRSVNQAAPQLIAQAFGDHAAELLRVMAASEEEQLRWANSITVGAQLAEPWRGDFARFGALPQVQEEQRRRALQDYFVPAQKTARGLGLTTELGLALCFDIHVQNGGVKKAAQAKIAQSRAAQSPQSEKDLRCTVANAVADCAREKFREDVRARKLAIATGAGTVHGRKLVLENWGLAEFPA